MTLKTDYPEKFRASIDRLPFGNLTEANQKYLSRVAHLYLLTFQELRILIEILVDFQMWQDKALTELWPQLESVENIKQIKEIKLKEITDYWNSIKTNPKNYKERPDIQNNLDEDKITFVESKKDFSAPILGKCPVASEKTLCCNLITLDAVNNCGFSCSYCSIQSFFPDKTITFEKDILEKLRLMNFDRTQIYHIGTGQSSDSLMWGNKGGTLDGLVQFAKENPNVILEFKTKSKNINYLLQNEIPPNIICTWSLNPQIIIDNEEHNTASLAERLDCAHQLAQKGQLVGFHFHPIVFYDQFEVDYQKIIESILERFSPDQVALISFGTLTYTRPVLKEIRSKKIYSKILQMPLVEASGKFSYPEETKIRMFSHLYRCFLPWHQQVFFYLCMEEKKLWNPVFGFEFENNEMFERAMKKSYMNKIQRVLNVNKEDCGTQVR